MTAKNHQEQRVQKLLWEARKLSGGARAAYLAKACGADLELRREVESLLEAEAQAGAFLQPTTPKLSVGPGSLPAGHRFGDYELLEEVGRGGMGVIYKARQTRLNRTVALKVLIGGQFATKQEILRFRAEAESAASLRHPNIVAIYETGECDGMHYFSMDFVAGRTLAQIVGEGGPLSAQLAGRYLVALAEAIDYAHRQGILHRDLKPSNVIIDSEDQPRITDFGLAKRLRGDFGLTITGQILGTPSYMPPEQCGGASASWNRHPTSAHSTGAPPAPDGVKTDQPPAPGKTPRASTKVGPWSDVYGLGGILYYLLTGRPPFQAESLEGVIAAVLHQDPVSPRLLNSSVPRDLETIVLKCLEKAPARRYRSALEVAEELRRFLRGEAVLARPLGPLGKGWRWCRREPLAAGAMALAAVGIVSACLFAFLSRQAEHRRVAEQRRAAVEAAWLTSWSGDSRTAEESIRRAELARASPSEVRMLRGALACQTGNYEEAIQELEQAVRLNPQSISAHALLALACSRTGHYGRTQEELRACSQLKLQTAEDHLFKALAESEWGEASAAGAALDQVVERHPSVVARLIRAQVRLNAVAATMDTQVLQGAQADASAVKAMLPDNPLALAISLGCHLMSSDAHEQAGRMQESAAALQEAGREAAALAAFSNHLEAIWGRQLYYKFIGDQSAVLRVLNQGSSNCRNSMLDGQYASALYSRGQFERALAVLDRWPAGAGFAGDFCRGYILAELPGGSARAIDEYKSLLEKQADISAVYYQGVLRFLGRRSEAIEACNRLRAGPLSSSVRRPWVERLLDYGAGRLTAGELLAAAPTTGEKTEAYFFIGLNLLAEGKREQARQHFEKAAGRHPVYTFDQIWSQAFLNRLREDPKWPPWLSFPASPVNVREENGD